MENLSLFKWFILMLVGLWIVWYVTGGPERIESQKGSLIKPLAPLDTGEVYGPKF